MDTYDELQAAVADFSGRSNLTSAIPTFISLTETRMARQLRVSWLEKRATATPTGAFIPLPVDYTGLRNIQLNKTYRVVLQQVSPQELDRIYPMNDTASGQYAFAIHDGQIEIRPIPVDEIQITYYHKPESLSATNQTNLYLQNAPDMLLYGALVEAASYMKDDGSLGRWAQLYGAAKDAVLEEEDQVTYPGEVFMRYNG